MVEHMLNGQHDAPHIHIQLIERDDNKDRWQTDRGVLTIHKTDGAFEGWEWDGDPTLVDNDDNATDDLQAIMDIFANEYA